MKIVFITALTLTAALAATTATAQDATCNNCGNVPDRTLRSIDINVEAGAGHAGEFGAMWRGTSGEAHAAKEGEAFSNFTIDFDSCEAGDCGQARVIGLVGASEEGASMAVAHSNQADTWAVAQNEGLAQVAGRFSMTMSRPATTPGSGH
jgi:hypothetical protein